MSLLSLYVFAAGFIAGSYLERQRTKKIVQSLFDLFKKEELKKFRTIDVENEN